MISDERETIDNSLEINSTQRSYRSHQQNSPGKNETNGKSFEPIPVELEHSDSKSFTPGVLRLYSLDNTCYMNLALEARSNCVPLTSYSLDLSSLMLSSSDQKSNGKLGKVFCKFLQSMWLKQKPGSTLDIVNPNSIASQISSTNPSFRSYSQKVVEQIFFFSSSSSNR